ncbi:hypothetical protein [Pacificimonas flava]|nr:hypothetical protein [Pacificimonas flava]
MTITLLDRPGTGEPLMPPARRSVAARVHAFATEIDDLVDTRISRADPVLAGCVVMHYAGIILAGTSCRRPLLFPEGEVLARRSGLDLILLRFDAQPRGVTFDIRLEMDGSWLTNFAVWRGQGEMWLVPEGSAEGCIQVTPFGLEVGLPAPFSSFCEREKGMVRALTFPSFKEGY